MPTSPEPGDPALRRLLTRSAFALVLFMMAAGVLALGGGDDRAEGPLGPRADSTIGPPPGEELIAYEESRRTAGTGLSGRRWVVVSFRSYVSAAEADQITGTADPVRYLVAAPGRPPEAVEDLGRWSEGERAAAAEEKADIERLLPTVDQPDFAAEYRDQIARLDQILTSLDPAGPVVFGVLVQTDGAQRSLLAVHPKVRLVDVGGTERPDAAELRGLRPEEVARAGLPPARP